MAARQPKKTFDGATLSPRLKPADEAGRPSLALPIGKSQAPGGAAVARAYKHAAGKSSTYAPEVVDMIYHMAREGRLDDAHITRLVEAKLAAERDTPHPPPPTTWDQLVFLSANLTRLVIDPYREKCNARVVLGPHRAQPLRLDWPIVYGGVDLGRLPDGVGAAFARAADQGRLAVCAPAAWAPPPDAAPARIVHVDARSDLPLLSGAAAVELTGGHASGLCADAARVMLEAVRSATGGRVPVGITAPAFNAARVVESTIALEPDFYACDAQWTQDAAPPAVLPELDGPPALNVLADTVECLRRHRREEDIQVLYRGGIRGGADAGKALCLGATAVTLGLSAAVALGHRITQADDADDLLRLLAEPVDPTEAARGVLNFAQSVSVEVTMLARACGKSSVTNMEPEDLRALTIAVSAATGIPVTGKDVDFRAVVADG